MKIPKYIYFRVRTINKGTSDFPSVGIEVEDASDIDVVEVVRCKDCKYSDWWGPEGKETLDCIHLDVPYVMPDFYCAWGEKKEDDEF